MTNFAFQQVDVFTSCPLLGNPLAVVVGADALTDTQMGAFANWTNLSETTFLLQPRMTGADYRVRIFTPQRELPFAAIPPWGAATSGSPRVGNRTAMRSCRNARSVLSAFGVDLVGSLSQHRTCTAAVRWRLTFWRASLKGCTCRRTQSLPPTGSITVRAGWRSCCVPGMTCWLFVRTIQFCLGCVSVLSGHGIARKMVQMRSSKCVPSRPVDTKIL